MLTPSDTSTLSHEEKDPLLQEKDALLEHKDVLIGQLVVRVQELVTRVQELESRLSKNSHNSSNPPSSDGLKKTQSLRRKSGKRPGGQVGHTGKTLRQAAVADHVVEQKLPERCDACHAALPVAQAQVQERRQVLDIPVARHEVTEYRTLSLVCQCGKLHESRFPEKVTEHVQYGPNIRAVAVHLTQGQLLPYARTSELMADLYQLDISPGTLHGWTREADALLSPSVQAIAQQVSQSPVVHVDESGLRVQAKLQWLHTSVTPTHTWYGVHAKRGIEAVNAFGVLKDYAGVLMHDRWAPYWLIQCVHALCNAHLLRELTFLAQSSGQAWPQRMMDMLLAAHRGCERARTQGITAVPSRQVLRWIRRYRALLDEGQALNPQRVKEQGKRGRAKQSDAFNLLRRLRDHEQEVLRFARDLSVPFTNNFAERAIRMPKVKQKISGCFRTFAGAQSFCTIRSYLDTARKHGVGMLEALRAAFNGAPMEFVGSG
ncbi:IS66 family transposase [Verminephrobacter aporrectodeae]|uniref:IS66 family transposase n=3 Tax=Verminephrobacter aporrectodeae TaxID=1110389 RepID=UPI0022444F87|nr:IS66 family transposase [Verminephrobacter aporrectodeae]